MKIQVDIKGWDETVRRSARAADGMKERVRLRIREGALETMREVKVEMPVDTGRARASWGSPEAEGIWEESDGGMSIEQGTNVHYVERLNDGSSKQAPAGFINAAAERARVRIMERLEGDAKDVME